LLYELDVPDSYSLIESVHSWIYPDIQPVPELTGDTFFARIYEIDGVQVPLLVSQELSGGKVSVSYPSKSISRQRIKTILNDALGLEVCMDGALNVIRDDPALSRISAHVSGIQPYLSPSVYEALIKTIIQQQISYRAASALTKKLVIQLAPKMEYDGLTLYAFPEPEAILRCGIEGLRTLGLGYKAEYIYDVVKLVKEGSLKTEDLKEKTFDEIFAILKPIRGIGKWTIQMLAIAGIGDYTVFPCNDLGVKNLMGRLFSSGGKRMTTNEVEEYAQQWGEDWPLVLYLLMSADVLGFLGKEGRQQTHKRASHK
jgi:3-methyladenine DNA glycosylase/8-oxoguanine DNA glycosylase